MRGGHDTDVSDLSPAILTRAIEVEPRFGDSVRVELVDLATQIQRGDALVVGVATSSLSRDPLAPYLHRIAEGNAAVLLVGPLPLGLVGQFPEGAILAHVNDLESPDALYLGVESALERLEQRRAAERRTRWLSRYEYELGELIEISRALSQERDLERLLHLILEKSRFITGADAGSIYVVESAPGAGERQLRFKLSQNDSVEFASREFTVPLSMQSFAGAAAVTRKVIKIDDAYAIPADEPYRFDPRFDQRVGYRTRSVIAVPMISAEDEVIGVIQLINKKRDPKHTLSPEQVAQEVVSFDQRSEDLLATLASQAGIALENALLYDEIRRIFDGFVRASVQAIEQRDPTTSGHSHRVSVLACGLLDAVDRTSRGPYAELRFSRRDRKELEYASLLHDFGKIGVREEVLVKAKKLYPHQLERVRSRFDYAKKVLENEALKARLEVFQDRLEPRELERIEQHLGDGLRELEEALRLVELANEPTILKEGDFSRIVEIGARTYLDSCGHPAPLLLTDEVTSLTVMRGSLHETEIAQIRSHVTHTFQFLSQIPWGKSFARIPLIAGAHHEKLNGTGYPRGLRGEDIPVSSRIMAIADIFDALTARDRPYKRAIPTERALDILDHEVADGHVDGELVQIFRESEIWKQLGTT